MSSNRIVGPWYRIGDMRIVPWCFGLMRAEFLEQRDYSEKEPNENGKHEVMEHGLRWVSAGRLPPQYDGPGAFGFWSTMATPVDDPKYGDRRFWRRFIQYWKAK